MLKASQKSQYKNLVQQKKAQHGLTNKPIRGITSHNLWESDHQKNDTKRDILDTNLSIRYYVGYLKLNREHRYNTLTPNYIKNIKRSLNTLDQEENVKLIYVTGQKGEHFSNGTDFRTLLHYKKDNKVDSINQYLTDLYSLQTLTAKINKPILGVAHGHSFNSGASLLAATGFPITTLDSKLSFNEVCFGFVPHGGSTYYLSRLPGEIGTCLALTGMPINGIDAQQIGISEDIIHTTETYEKEVAEFINSMDWPMPTGHLLTNRGKDDKWRDRLLKKQQFDLKKAENDLLERGRKKHENLLYEEFYEPKDKIPSTTADSEFKYKKLMEQYNELNFADQHEPGYLEWNKGVFQNYYRYVIDYVKGHSGHDFPKNKSLLNHKQVIDRCFYANTVEEIIENLKREDNVFAKQCLDRMSQNSLLSMKLALKMLRDAKNLDYKGALQNEINVSLNKIQDKEFDLGVSEILMKPGKNGSRPEFSKNVSDDQVKGYFEKNKWAEGVELDVVEKAMLPTRFYYQKFSDQIRLWVNESSTPQKEVRESFETELKASLREQGIDLRDRALTIESARDALYQQEMSARRESEWSARTQQIFADKQLQAKYQQEVSAQIEELQMNNKQFYQLVNQQVQAIFQNAYLEKLNMIYDKSKEAHSLEKRRMYIRFKKFLMHSRIMTYSSEEFDRTLNQLESMPFKEIHLTEKWDESFVKQSHPELHRSVLSHLAKAVGRRNVAPLELTRQYLTDPALAKTMNVLTFDKEELLKLRKDILENPQKYETILSTDTGYFHQPDRTDERERRLDEYQYWYRVLNEGHNPIENLNRYQHFIAYKDFVSNVESKALDTLRLCVQRLINDFESQEGVNEIKDFSKKDKETKRQSLARLLEQVYQYEGGQQKKKKTSNQQQLTSKERPVSEIKRIINNLIESDQHVKKLLPDEQNIQNPLISNLKDSFMQSLYSNIEFVLLNNQKGELSKEVLQKRLAEITNVQGINKQQSTQLRVIDAYLNEANASQVIKQALQLTKPMFFNDIRSKLDLEGSKLASAVKMSDISTYLLFFYMMNLRHPHIRESQLMKTMQGFSEDRDRLRYLDELMPEFSGRYHLKNLVSMMSEGTQALLDQAQSTEDKARVLEKKVKSDLLNIKMMGQQVEAQQEAFDGEGRQRRTELLKSGFDAENAELGEVKKNPQFSLYNYSVDENNKIIEYATDAERVYNQVFNNSEQFRTQLPAEEWLHILGTSIKEYGLDIQSLFRYSLEEQEYLNRDFLKEAQNSLQAPATMQWSDIADYSLFLSHLYDQGKAAIQSQDAQKNFETTQEYIIKQMKGEDEVKNQSVFQTLLNKKGFQQRGKILREELSDFNRLQQRLVDNNRAEKNIRFLLSSAPKEVQNTLTAILDSSSSYLNLAQVEQLLEAKQYDQLTHSSSLIDREGLINDIKKQGLVQKFIDNYQHVKTDVVSIAEAKETINNVQDNQQIDAKTKSQISMVLDYVNDSLKFVPHSRRKDISLGEFMKRHHFLNSSSLFEFGSDILKNKIEETLGKTLDLEAAEVIDWEFAGTRTHPYTQKQVDEAVLKAAKEGKHLDSQADIDQYIDKQFNRQDETHTTQEMIQFVNEATGRVEVAEVQELEYDRVLQEAKQMTELKPEFTEWKNYYENQVWQEYTQPDVSQTKIQDLIRDYTVLRLKDCLLNDNFKQRVNSNNGHIYLKMLKESIVEELQLGGPAEITDMSYDKLENFTATVYNLDAEAKFNMASVNNQNAIGYDNIEKRVIDPSDQKKNRDLAHETLFDKLLADYFQNKRGQYANSNDLLEALNQHFSDATKYPEGHPLSKDRNQRQQASFPFAGEAGLAFKKLQNDREGDKEDLPRIKPQDFTEMMELDIATAQALQNNKNGLSVRLRDNLSLGEEKIPEYFDLFDPRKPAKKWVEDKLNDLLEEMFEMRRRIEKTLSRNELMAYDKVLIKYLEKDVLIPKLQQECDNTFNQLSQMSQLSEMKNEGIKVNAERQFIKSHNNQAKENREIKNEDAYYKFLAYSAMLEKNRRADVTKTRNDDEMAKGVHNFTEFYKEELHRDVKREPRQINESEYQQAKKLDQRFLEKPFLTHKEREQDYVNEFSVYKENKKEQIERNQLFYVLEQFFAHAKQKQDPMDKAQNAIVEYFKDTENTYFFDKNKIQ